MGDAELDLSRKEANDYLYMALTIGEEMLISGAEVSRVEDTINRICKSLGMERIDVLTITASIVVTIYSKDLGAITQTRRINTQKIDFYKLDKLNSLSRKICEKNLSIEEVEKEIKHIASGKQYSFYAQLLIYAMISGSFSLFFGGNMRDAFVSAVIGVIIKCMDAIAQKVDTNTFLSTLIFSFTGGLLAIFFVRIGIGDSVHMISIGNIMLLIPGVVLTNSMRDMFKGDTISGALKFTEALLLAMTIAFGFAIAALVGGIFHELFYSIVNGIYRILRFCIII